MSLIVCGSSVLKKFNHNILPYAQEAYSGVKLKEKLNK